MTPIVEVRFLLLLNFECIKLTVYNQLRHHQKQIIILFNEINIFFLCRNLFGKAEMFLNFCDLITNVSIANCSHTRFALIWCVSKNQQITLATLIHSIPLTNFPSISSIPSRIEFLVSIIFWLLALVWSTTCKWQWTLSDMPFAFFAFAVYFLLPSPPPI